MLAQMFRDPKEARRSGFVVVELPDLAPRRDINELIVVVEHVDIGYAKTSKSQWHQRGRASNSPDAARILGDSVDAMRD